jgi:hypothetical protein
MRAVSGKEGVVRIVGRFLAVEYARMGRIHEAAEALTTATYRAPKTILGFFAIVLGILVSGAAIIIGVLAGSAELRHLVLPILIFAGGVLLVVLIGVFVTAWKDPTILMLGQVTGEVFIENRRLTLGDSNIGEIKETVLSTPSGVKILPNAETAENRDDR